MSNTEVLIVGSGPCGIAVADTLRANGFNSLIFEAGAIPIHNDSSYKNMAEYRQMLKSFLTVNEDEWKYETNSKDYDWIRVRACGGRTLRWNGWLVRPGYGNFISSQSNSWWWPFNIRELEALWVRSQQWLGGRISQLEPQYANLGKRLGYTVLPKMAAVSENGIRPFWALDRLFCPHNNQRTSAQIRLKEHAIVTRVICNSEGVEGIEYIDRNTGKSHRIKSNIIVLSASTIETTRLLLCSEIKDYTRAYGNIGKRYTDHIAASYLAILPNKFTGEAIGGPMERSATIPNPFNAQRRREQRGSFTIELHGPNPASIYEPEILKAAGLDPVIDANVSCISVNAIGELCHSSQRYITISDKLDSLGRQMPKVNIEWDAEVKLLASSMEAEAESIATALAGISGRAIKVRETLTLGGTGTSHEAGTCAIGISEHDSVVNLDGQVHGIKGLFIADASLLPSGLDCHPTLTVVALALNTADGVIRFLHHG